MSTEKHRTDVERLKQLCQEAWERVAADVPGERVYAFGLYTDGSGTSMSPFAMGELGLERVARRYAEDGIYDAASAADKLRWSTADSPYANLDDENTHDFADRAKVYDLSPPAAAREIVASGAVLDRLKADFEQIRDFAFLPERGEIAVAVFGHTRRPLVLWKPPSLPANAVKTA